MGSRTKEGRPLHLNDSPGCQKTPPGYPVRFSGTVLGPGPDQQSGLRDTLNRYCLEEVTHQKPRGGPGTSVTVVQTHDPPVLPSRRSRKTRRRHPIRDLLEVAAGKVVVPKNKDGRGPGCGTEWTLLRTPPVHGRCRLTHVLLVSGRTFPGDSPSQVGPCPRWVPGRVTRSPVSFYLSRDSSVV